MCQALERTDAIAYVDDILIDGSTHEEHDVGLRKVLRELDFGDAYELMQIEGWLIQSFTWSTI